MSQKLNIACCILIIALISCGGPSGAAKSKDSLSGKDSVGTLEKSKSSVKAASFETAEELLQAMADEINDGKLDNWSRFYVSESDLEKSDIAPLVKNLSRFRGNSADKLALAQYFLKMAEKDQQKILANFIVQPKAKNPIYTPILSKPLVLLISGQKNGSAKAVTRNIFICLMLLCVFNAQGTLPEMTTLWGPTL
jgi:hypothetical protein